MSNKPIEIGCRVMITASEYSGKIGVVIDKICPGEKYKDYKVENILTWAVESLGELFTVYNTRGEIFRKDILHVFSNRTLIRLPDEDEILKLDKEQELENA